MERSCAVLGQSPPVSISQLDERHKRETVMNAPLYFSQPSFLLRPVSAAFLSEFCRIVTEQCTPALWIPLPCVVVL